MRVTGFDSKRIKRTTGDLKNSDGTPHLFQACLGVGITVPSYSKFASAYQNIMNDLFTANGLKQERKAYKAADINGKFIPLGVNALETLFGKLAAEVGFVEVYYSFFFEIEPDQMRQRIVKPLSIGVNWGNPDRFKRVDGLKFLDEIEPAYPLVCAWAKQSQQKIKDPAKIVVDGCSIKPCNAWKACLANPNLSIIPWGDRCNYVISCADLFAAAIDARLARTNHRLSKDLVNIFPELKGKMGTTFIGPGWLHGLKPQDEFTVNTESKNAHPLFVLFNPPSKIFGDHSKKILENSPLMSIALNAAVKTGGAVKFFDRNDVGLLTEQDFLVTHNEEATNMAKELQNLGILAKQINLDELKQI